MATDGPRYPGTVASLANAGSSENANAWLNPSNVGADDGTESQITAATYDSPDISELLVASNFGFNLVDATITGITVEIDRRSIIASSGVDNRVQLAKGTTFASLVGANKATATVWPSSTAVATYGGSSDLWSTTWTEAEINASSFAVMLSTKANIANADIGVDYIRVTVTYTENLDKSGTVSATGGGVSTISSTTTGTLETTNVYFDVALGSTPISTRVNTGFGWAKLHDGTVMQFQPRTLTLGTSGTPSTIGATTITGPTAGVEINPNISTPVLFISPPLAVDATIAGSTTFNLYAYELTTSVNAAVDVLLGVIHANGSFEEFHRTTRTTELGTVSSTLVSFSETVTSFAVLKGERLVFVPFFKDGGGTMASGLNASLQMGTGTLSHVVLLASAAITFLSTTPSGTTVYLLNDAASGSINPGSATEKDAWTTRGSTSTDPGTTTYVTGPTTGVQYAPGGTAYEWYTRPLQATTLIAPVLANIRAYDSGGSNSSIVRVELAITDSDGTNAVVWGTNGGGIGPGTNQEQLTAGDTAIPVWVSGPDAAITDGKRIRIRLYFDDVYRLIDTTTPATAMVNTGTGRISFGGPTASVAGDSYLTFSQTLTEYSSGPQTVDAGLITLTNTIRSPLVNQLVGAALTSLTASLASPQANQSLAPARVSLAVTIPTLLLQQDQTVTAGLVTLTTTFPTLLANQRVDNSVVGLTTGLSPPGIGQSVAPALVSLTTTLPAPEAIGAQIVEPYGVSVTFDPITTQSFTTGDEYPHSMIEVGGDLFVGLLETPAKLYKWADPTDLSTYSVLTFSTNEDYLNSMVEVGGYIYTAHNAYQEAGFPFHYKFRVSKIDAAALTYSNFAVVTTGSSTVNPGLQLSVTTDGTYLYVLGGYFNSNSFLAKIDLSDGSVDATLTLTGYPFGHTIQYHDGDLYMAGVNFGASTAWAATCTTALTGLTTLTVASGANKLITDDSAIVNGEYWLGMEGTGEATGTIRRVALDMSGYTDSLTGTVAQIYGIFLTDDGVVAAPHHSLPGSLVFLTPDGRVIKNHNFAPGQNSVNEFQVIGGEAYYTFFLTPTGMVGRATWAVDGTSSLVVPLTVRQPSIKQELAPSVVSLTTTLHSPTISIGSSDQTVSPEFFSQEWGHTDLLLNFTFGGGIGPTVHQSVGPIRLPLSIDLGTHSFGTSSSALTDWVSLLDSDGEKYVNAYSAPASGIVDALHARIWSVGTAGTARAVIYADSGGNPGALVAQGSDVSIPVAGSDNIGLGLYAESYGIVTLPFASGVAVVSGTTYWIGVHYVTSAEIRLGYVAGGSLRSGFDTFAGGASDPFGSASSGGSTLHVYASMGPTLQQQVAPSVLSLTTTLHSPTATVAAADQNVAPDRIYGGSKLALGYGLPVVNQSVSPGLVSLTTSLHSPGIQQAVSAGLVSLPATLHSPSVDQQVRDFVEAAIGWPMVVTLRSPTIQIVQTVEAGLVTLAATIHSPIVTAADAPQTLEPGVLTLPATLHSPTITAPVSPALVSLATTVHAPTITAPVSPDRILISTAINTHRIDQLVGPALVSLTTTVHAPTVPQSVAPALLSLATTLHSPTAAIEAQTVSPDRISLGTNIRSTRGIGDVLPGVGTGTDGQVDEALPLHLSLGFRAWGYAGSDSSGATADISIADNVWVSPFTATSTGIVTALSAQLWAVIPSSFLARAVIYLDSGGAPSVLWGDGPDVVVTNHAYFSRVELPLGTHVDSGFGYWIGVHFRLDDADPSPTARFQVELTANQTLYSVADFDDGAPTSWVTGGSFVGPLHVHALMGPAILQSPGAAPGLISLATTLHAPEITGGTQTVGAGLISLATTVHAPAVQAAQTVSPGVVSLTLTLLSPTVAVDQTVSSGVVSLGLTLRAPTVELAAAQTVSPGVVSLAATIRSPSAGLQGLVSLDAALSLSLAAHAPTVSTLAAPTASPNLLALTLTAHAPTLQTTQTVSPSRVSLAVTPATHAVILSASAWRRLRAVQYHAVVYSPDANGGPGNPKLELDPHVLNLVWSQTQNLAGQAAFALARRNPVLDQITWMVDHVKIFRETAAGTQTVFAGKLVQPVLSGTDCFVYCLDYMGFLQLSITGYRTAYATKKIGSEVIAPEWALAKALTNSPFAFVTTGTIQNPLALDGTTEITTNADFGVVLFDRLFTFNTLAEMSMANTANNVKFEITRVAGHTFNLWRNYGTNQTSWAGVMPGTVASYDFDGGKDGQRFDLRTVLSDGAGGQVEYSVQTTDADTTLLRRLQASVAIRTLFGASGGTTETDQGKAALARQLVVSTRYPRLVRVSPRHGDFPLFSGNDLGDRFRVIVQKPDKTGDFYDGYLLWQQVIGAWEPSGGGELLDLYLRGQT